MAAEMTKKHFPEFYRKHIKQVYKFLLFRVAGKKELAEDLAQDVFVKAFQAFESYEPEKGESAWILTIARNHLINTLQKQREQLPLEDVEAILADPVQLVEQLALAEDEARLMQALHALPKTDADLIRMKHLEGWSYEEIAQQTQKTPGSLRIQAHRAIKALARILKQKSH